MMLACRLNFSMTNFLERINFHFNQNIEVQHLALETLPLLINEAAAMMAHSLLSDGKILSCGNGHGVHDAGYLSTLLLNRYLRERPSLPCVALNSDAAALTVVSHDFGINEIYAKQIRAIGQDGDILFAVSEDGNGGNIIQAIQAAHDREMSVIMLTGRDGGDSASLLTQEDVEIRVPGETLTHTRELHRVIIHSLCDLIDTTIFGEE